MKVLLAVGKRGHMKQKDVCFFFAQSKVLPFQHTCYSFLNAALKLSWQPMKVACLVMANSTQIISSTS
jgi:hypothetical protein